MKQPISINHRSRMTLAGVLSLLATCCASHQAADASSLVRVPASVALSSADDDGNASGKRAPDFDEEPPELVDPGAPGTSPLVGARLYVDSDSQLNHYTDSIRGSDPDLATTLDRINLQPQAFWLGEWNDPYVFRATASIVQRAKAEGSVPVFVVYNIPYRDCGQHSRGGLPSEEAYRRWVRQVAAGIGEDQAVVILEPDALAHLQECLSDAQKRQRYASLKDAVWALRQGARTAVYLDAGHPRWIAAADMAERLKLAGIENAHGFSLNVSNYVTTQENLEYGAQLSALTGGAHFVVDTSRNGRGPAPGDAWCNPPDRRLGGAPTTRVEEPLCDAYLWIKRPGESDGECEGGPRAGALWLERATQLAL